MATEKRSYKVTKKDGRQVARDAYGTYTGRTPGEAAKKAFTAIVRKAAKKSKAVVFCIACITRGAGAREFCYQGRQTKLSPPKKVTVNVTDDNGAIVGERVVVYKTKSRVLRLSTSGTRKFQQGYKDRLNESLGSTRGSKRTKKQSYKSRGNESRGARKPSGSYGFGKRSRRR